MSLADKMGSGRPRNALFEESPEDLRGYTGSGESLTSMAPANKHGAVGQWSGTSRKEMEGGCPAVSHTTRIDDLFAPRPTTALALPYGGSVGRVEYLFSNLKVDFDRSEEPHSWSSTISRPTSSSSPRPPSSQPYLFGPGSTPSNLNPAQSLAEIIRSAEGDPAFKNDLAHVLIWFSEDLTSQQRLMTAYTLAKNLAPWQMDILHDCLEKERSMVKVDGWDPLYRSQVDEMFRERTIKPASLLHQSKVHPDPAPAGDKVISAGSKYSYPTDGSSTPSSGEAASVNPQLFYSDFSNWLRLHRLHKYQANFKGQHDCRKLLALTDADLESLGVLALGARRKFLRLFEMIKS